MRAFRFPLQKALELRARQLDLEEAKFQRAAAALAAVDREREVLLSSLTAAEALVRGVATVPGEDLAALGAFRVRTGAEEKRIAQRRAQNEKALEEQRSIMLEARRRLRLLERLKERRHAEWSAEAAKELEEMASESYLARWRRDAAVEASREQPVK
jgi:flagellar export protein FliJ